MLRLQTQIHETPIANVAPFGRTAFVLHSKSEEAWPRLKPLQTGSTHKKNAFNGFSSMCQCIEALAHSLKDRKLLRQELERMTSVCHGYHKQLQTLIDQRNILYRNYASSAAEMKSRHMDQQSRTDKLLTELASANSQVAALEAQLQSATNISGQGESTAVSTVVLRCKLDRVSLDSHMLSLIRLVSHSTTWNSSDPCGECRRISN